MPRRIFNLLTALSMLLCLATAGLWIGSLLHSPIDFYQNADRRMSVDRGSLNVLLLRTLRLGPRGLLSPPPTSRWHFLGLSYVDLPAFVEPVGVFHDFTLFHLALAWPLLLFALLPAMWLLLHLRQCRSRPAAHLCPTCRYDLRATPNPHRPLLPRCPECGTPAPTISTNTPH